VCTITLGLQQFLSFHIYNGSDDFDTDVPLVGYFVAFQTLFPYTHTLLHITVLGTGGKRQVIVPRVPNFQIIRSNWANCQNADSWEHPRHKRSGCPEEETKSLNFQPYQ
jgi:hypothetical protein